MRAVVASFLCCALSGCYVGLSGHASSSGGATATTASGSVVPANASGVRLSFGTPASPGGQVSFDRGTSALVVLGGVIADAVNYLAGRFRGDAPAASGTSSSIADTCSCYGYEPDLTSAPPPR
jgi:hypothetical protein